ncbi:regulator of chromosome condensation 1/beta-lactamase-inhibitor protein II [Peziza echinospora]|nr:regulator of chromosome condensation 1/beta-lactamase-inhibitor protein II [Peziza echinospora]
MAAILSLSSDIILQSILPLLSPVDFLSLCSACVYWRKLTTSTFRLPSQPLREEGWKELYKNLATAKVFTWGSNQGDRLGHSYRQRYTVPIPQEAITPDGEVIVDIVSGGWSITFLTASGRVYTHGQISEYSFANAAHLRPSMLQFPPNYESKIAQVSSGRSHILGLSDDGVILEWAQNVLQSGTVIKFAQIETKSYPLGSNTGGGVHGTIKKVVAGWDHSVALVNGVGLVVWWETPNGQTTMETDGEVVLGTSYTEQGGTDQDELSEEVGEVLDFMAGASFLVFLTTSGKVFAMDTRGPGSVTETYPTQLFNFSAPADERPMSYISGSFNKFAVFNNDGLVYIGTKELVLDAIQKSRDGSAPQIRPDGVLADKFQPKIMPSLQKRNIVKIAFGDYHSLALTSDGKVLSWGTESRACGCLGQGPREIAIERGARNDYGDLVLDEPTEVKFDLEWENMTDLKAYSKSAADEKGFVFNITAAGWHSGALMLDPSRGRHKKPQLKNLMATFPQHLGQPPFEASHGGRLHSGESSGSRTTRPDFTPDNPSPFIAHEPPMPTPGARPGPAMTGGPLQLGPNDRLSSASQEARRQARLAAARQEDEEETRARNQSNRNSCTTS